MTRRVFSVAAVLFAVGAAGCGVHQAAEPTLTGPSSFATNLTVTATPDSITQDGAARSTVVISAIGASGQPMANLSVRVDMAVGGVMADFGTLSQRNLVTGSNGQATVIYTAPPAPPPSAAGVVNHVSIVATPVGTDAQVSQGNTFSADIKLVPLGVILPPAGTPTASFVVSPTPVNQNVGVTFDGSASTPGTNATQIVSYSWNYGDGDTAVGITATHTYRVTGTFTVTLTVTNDRGISASASQAVAVSASASPTATFVTSVSAPVVGQSILFNAAQSQATAGHTITQFAWNFGDGTTGTDSSVAHAYAAAGTYAVTLVVTDDAGQQGSTSKSVTVGTSAPTASFTSTAAASPAHTVIFDGSASSAVGGATIATYNWDFGDGATGTGAVATHSYNALLAGQFVTVTLTVTDNNSTPRSAFKATAVLVP